MRCNKHGVELVDVGKGYMLCPECQKELDGPDISGYCEAGMHCNCKMHWCQCLCHQKAEKPGLAEGRTGKVRADRNITYEKGNMEE